MITLNITFWIELVLALILMYILNIILYKPVRRILEERKQKMDEIRGEAEKYERNAQALVDNFNRKLAEARAKGQAEREKFKESARQVERELLEASTKEAEKEKSEQLGQLMGQIEAARKELKDKVEAFALEIAQKLLGRAI